MEAGLREPLPGAEIEVAPPTAPHRAVHEQAVESTIAQDGSLSSGALQSSAAPTNKIAPNSLEGTRPLAPCRACGSVTYWATQNGRAWICQGCHATDLHPEEVRWHVVEDVRRITAVTRPKVGCSKCKFSGFEFFADGRWTVCRCNDGFDWRGDSEQGGGGA